MMWRRAGAGQCLRRCDTDRASSLIARLFWTVIGISWWASGQVWVVEDVVVRLKTVHRCGRIPRARLFRREAAARWGGGEFGDSAGEKAFLLLVEFLVGQEP